MRVIVAGAGIGGLVAALALHAAGADVEVLESAQHVRPLGLGINLLPHAVRELTDMGLGGALATTGIPARELRYHDRFGNLIRSEPRGVAAGYRWPQYSIHRGELQSLLLGAVRERLGWDAVRTGVAVERFEQTQAAVTVLARERATGRPLRACADLLVGADGIHSVVRAQLHPAEGAPIWNGIRMWRGLTETEPFLGGRTMIMAGSNLRAKFVAYPVSRTVEERGRAAVNWVAEVRRRPDGVVAPGDWTRRGRVDDVLPHFADWHFEWLDIPALIRTAPRIWEYPMVDRDPLPSWGTGRVTLLGDAAHPMYPIGSNGASQAIIDARVLAWNVARVEAPVAALRAYEDMRRDATGAVVLANRQMGPEGALAIVERRAPRGFGRIDDVLDPAELDSIAETYRLAAGFDPQTLNAAPSWDVRPPGHVATRFRRHQRPGLATSLE